MATLILAALTVLCVIVVLKIIHSELSILELVSVFVASLGFFQVII